MSEERWVKLHSSILTVASSIGRLSNYYARAGSDFLRKEKVKSILLKYVLKIIILVKCVFQLWLIVRCMSIGNTGSIVGDSVKPFEAIPGPVRVPILGTLLPYKIGM